MYPVRNILVLCMCFILCSCGFTPLYGTDNNDNLQPAFDNIYIENIADSSGLYLRNNLTDKFYAHGRPINPYYLLSIEKLREKRSDLDITKSADATRAQLKIETTMVLKAKTTGEVLLQRQLVSITSYNILRSQFTTHVSEESARKSALNNLSRQIETQLSLYFSRSL